MSQADPPDPYTRASADAHPPAAPPPTAASQYDSVQPPAVHRLEPEKHTNGPTDGSAGRRAAAVVALEKRGIDDYEDLLDVLSPEVIVATCEWWDRTRNPNKGLLVWKLRRGGVEPKSTEVELPPRGGPKPIIDESLLPVFFKSHADWDRGRGYEVECETGKLMIVTGTSWPLEVECDSCDFIAGLTKRALTDGVRMRLGL